LDLRKYSFRDPKALLLVNFGKDPQPRDNINEPRLMLTCESEIFYNAVRLHGEWDEWLEKE